MAQYRLEYLDGDIPVEHDDDLVFERFEDAMSRAVADFGSAHTPDVVYVNWSDDTVGVWTADFVVHDATSSARSSGWSSLGTDRARITRTT